MIHLFGQLAEHRHFDAPPACRREPSPNKSENGRHHMTLRSTSKARTYKTTFGDGSVVVKRFYDAAAFISELFIYELLKGSTYIPKLAAVYPDRCRLVMQLLHVTRPATTLTDLDFLFSTLGSIHGQWERLWQAGGLIGHIDPFRLSDDVVVTDNELRILDAFGAVLLDEYVPLSIGDAKLEHVLVCGRERFLIDFDAAKIGRMDATDLVLGLAYCPKELKWDVGRHLRAYDTARAAWNSRVRPLAGFGEEFSTLAGTYRRRLAETLGTQRRQ